MISFDKGMQGSGAENKNRAMRPSSSDSPDTEENISAGCAAAAILKTGFSTTIFPDLV